MRIRFPQVHNVQLHTIATGIGNVIGNKGGVGIAMFLNETSLCFIGSHLAAHQEKVLPSLMRRTSPVCIFLTDLGY